MESRNYGMGWVARDLKEHLVPTTNKASCNVLGYHRVRAAHLPCQHVSKEVP